METNLNNDLSLSVLNVAGDQSTPNVLYVENDISAGDNLEISIKNIGLEDRVIDTQDGGNPNQENYSFFLKFQPNTVEVDMDVEVRSWDTKTKTWQVRKEVTFKPVLDPTDKSVTIYFLSPKKSDQTDRLVLPKKGTTDAEPFDSLRIILSRVKPTPGRSRGSNIEFQLRDQKRTANGQHHLVFMAQTYLTIFNHQGERYIPIKVSLNTSQLLNDGINANPLTLTLFNTGQDSINFDSSTIVVTWDVADGNTPKSYALTTKGEEPDTISIFGKEVNKESTQDINPSYKLDNYSTPLDSGKSVSIAIKFPDLKTSLPAGIANLYINYLNVPGYWPGTIVVPLERTAVFQVQQKDLTTYVGIGTKFPGAPLEAFNSLPNWVKNANDTNPVTVMRLSRAGVKDKSYNNTVDFKLKKGDKLPVYASTQLDIKLNSDQSSEPDTTVLSLKANRNVGIGTTKPRGRLDIAPSNETGDVFGVHKIIGTGNLELYGDNEGTNIGVLVGANGNVRVGPKTRNNHNNAPVRALEVEGHGHPQFRIADRSYYPNAFWEFQVFQNARKMELSCYETIAGHFTGSGTYVKGSDINLKQDIDPLSGMLDQAMQLQPVQYRFKSEPNQPHKNLGFIAQEVEKIFPGTVSERSDGTKGLAYSELIPVAIGAVQELNKQFELLQTENQRQASRITQLEKQLDNQNDRLAQLELALLQPKNEVIH